MIKKITALLIITFSLLKTSAQDISQYQKHWFIEKGDTLPYRLLLPKSYDPSKKYPLILMLHGAGERGNDNELQLVHGSKLFLQEQIRNNFPAIVVFPQCPASSFWSNVQFKIDTVTKSREFKFLKGGAPTVAMRLLLGLLGDITDRYKLDKDQLYVGGLSMGGMGTFELVRRKPKMFAAAFPICGGANPETAKKLKKVNWWIFHGAKDNVVPVELSMTMAEALKQQKANVKLTIYPEANHNSWDPAFAEPDLMRWLFSHKK